MDNIKNKNIMKINKIFKKSALLYIFIVIISMCFISADEVCNPNWDCTDWSECLGNAQIRSCIDTNNCENNSAKPFENQSCAPSCTSNWDCTDWTPEKCPKNRIQERNCADLNNCENIKPPELKLCTYESDFSWLLKVIIGVIILIIIFIIRLIIKLLKK